MHRPLPLGAALVLTGISAALFGMAFPPWGTSALAYVALVPLLLALRSGGAARAVGLAWLWGSIWAWVVAGALPESIARFYDQPLWIGMITAGLVFTVMSTVYYMLFAAVDHWIVRGPRSWTPLLVGAAWVTVEWGRCQLFTGTRFFIGNPWALIGYTHSSGSLAQVASVTGVYGISFVLVVFNAGIAHVIADWLDRSASPAGQRGSRALTLLLATTPVVAASLAGGVMLRAAPPIDRTEGDFREVGVAQGNLAPGRTWRSDHYAGNLDVYLELTRKVAERETVRTVIWPEAAMSFYVETDEELRAAITATQRASDLELIAGGPRVEGGDRPSYFNSMFHFDASGTLRDTYDKEYLVPFFEFFPLEGFDFLRRDFEGPRSFEHGAGDSTPFETRLGKVGILVCGEAMLPSAARDRVLAGAEILVSPSNDSWIEDEHFAQHMLRVAGMRAIEQRRFLVRSSTSGPSAVVDPWGRILVKTDSFQRAVLVGRVEPLQKTSLYTRLGDAFAYGCVIVALLAALIGAAHGVFTPR